MRHKGRKKKFVIKVEKPVMVMVVVTTTTTTVVVEMLMLEVVANATEKQVERE